MEPFVSVFVPCKNEEAYITQVMQDLGVQDYPPDRLEFLMIDGKSDDRTAEIIKEFAQSDHRFKYVLNESETVPYAFNTALKLAKGEVIVIMGAHSTYPRNYISELIKQLQLTGADNVGGVLETLPAQPTPKCEAIASAMSSPFGMGNSAFRIGSDKVMEADTVTFGCYRRSVFEKIGGFDTDLTRNQDDEFNGRLIASGGQILLIPWIKIGYFARKDYRSLWRMFFQYGYFKPLVMKKLGKPATLRQFAPPLFVLSLLLTSVAGFALPYAWIALGAIVTSWLLGAAFFGINILSKKKLFSLLRLGHVVLAFATIHLSYGLGYLTGVLDFVLLGNRKPSLVNPVSSR
ncbi:MAG: hypothetical protein Kow0075_01680 [Salibacteraceae bacterium]